MLQGQCHHRLQLPPCLERALSEQPTLNCRLIFGNSSPGVFPTGVWRRSFHALPHSSLVKLKTLLSRLERSLCVAGEFFLTVTLGSQDWLHAWISVGLSLPCCLWHVTLPDTDLSLRSWLIVRKSFLLSTFLCKPLSLAGSRATPSPPSAAWIEHFSFTGHPASEY